MADRTHRTPAERSALGKQGRERVPRETHGDWAPSPDWLTRSYLPPALQRLLQGHAPQAGPGADNPRAPQRGPDA